MRRALAEILSSFVVLIVLYLLLIHATGFARDVAALGSATSGLARTFQGR